MKGTNTLNLNQETMCEALQLWANAKFKDGPKVTKVEAAESSNTHRYDQNKTDGFAVTVEEPAVTVDDETPP